MEKLYYTIGEVSKLADVEPHVLRYWETVFPELKPAKNRAGKRIYTQKDISTVFQLKFLIKDKEYSTAGARKALKEQNEFKAGQPGTPDMFSVPQDLRRDLKEIRLLLQDIHDKL